MKQKSNRYFFLTSNNDCITGDYKKNMFEELLIMPKTQRMIIDFERIQSSFGGQAS